LGPELLMTIDRAAPRAVRSQLEEGLRTAIRSGRLEPGEKLPSSRELAHAIGVSRGLVTECYQQLQSEGYLHSEVGSATRVAAAAAALPPVQTPPAAKPSPMAVDFIAGVPDLASFPGSDWLWAQREAFRQAPTHAVGYGDPAGAAELRTVLASYVRRVRAADVDAGQVLACSGFAQGLSLTLAALAARGIRHVGFEDPGYDRAVETTARRAGVTAVPIPVDSCGIDVGALASTSAQAVVVSPAHQWPTGVVLAAGRRRDLVAWAAEVDGFVVEDDYDAEFRYDRDPVGSLQGLAPDRVVTIGTVSKSLAPALRLGWVLSPAELTEPITAGKRDADRGTPTLDQLALAHLMRSGRFDRHLRRMRTLYAGRRRTLTEALTELAPQVRLSGLAAGFHAVAHLPDRDEAHVIGAARDRGVGLYGMSQHRASGLTRPPQLVLGFGNLTDRAIRSGIADIADLLGASRPRN
jgi:GntR family transcriptional regulator/MocR family aminotransferase